MNQYCRYCGFASEGDVYYCSAFNKILSESKLKHANNCEQYSDCGMDLVTGKDHEPKEYKTRRKAENKYGQIRFFR